MQEPKNQVPPDAEKLPDSRQPYEPPELKCLGTIHDLTRTKPGPTPRDNDPFQPGSRVL
jgi:hypothetical protein